MTQTQADNSLASALGLLVQAVEILREVNAVDVVNAGSDEEREAVRELINDELETYVTYDGSRAIDLPDTVTIESEPDANIFVELAGVLSVEIVLRIALYWKATLLRATEQKHHGKLAYDCLYSIEERP